MSFFIFVSVLLLFVVIHRGKSDDMYKDTDDIRENIINYEDEGGGEGDMTGYDLNVLRLTYSHPETNGKHPTGSERRLGMLCSFIVNYLFAQL